MVLQALLRNQLCASRAACPFDSRARDCSAAHHDSWDERVETGDHV